MYSNFNFQFLENSGFFLRHHKGNINSLALALSISLTITRVGGGKVPKALLVSSFLY